MMLVRIRSSILTALFLFTLCGSVHAEDLPAADDNPTPSLGSSEGNMLQEDSNAAKEKAAQQAAQNPSAPSAPEAQPAIPVESIPGKTSSSPKGVDIDTDNKKDIYEQYNDYLEQEKTNEVAATKVDQRNMFPHENGTWQVGLTYTRNALSGYNYNYQSTTPNQVTQQVTPVYANSQGGNLLITWFPLHNLSIGRLGFGIVGGVFWNTYNVPTLSYGSGVDPNTGDLTNSTTSTSASPLAVMTYGVRAVYELDYVLGQVIVPYAFVGADEVVIQGYSVSAADTNGTSQTFVSWGRQQLVSEYVGAGFHLNLNRIEPGAASRALVNVGIRKFYISYSALDRLGTLSGLTHNVGLNFEF
jgi:hypothetical protein